MKTLYDYYLETGALEICERFIFSCGCSIETNFNEEYENELRLEIIDGTFQEYLAINSRHMYIENYSAVKMEGTTLVVEEKLNFMCMNCKNNGGEKIERIYCYQTKKPVGFDDMPLHHGICAFEREDVVDGIKHLTKILEDENYETCCSTKHIGAVGATFIAEVITASNEDLFTVVDKTNGHRYYDAIPSNTMNVIYDVKDHMPSYRYNDEFVTRKHQLQSLWYKTDASDDEKEAMISLAEFLGVKAYEVEEKDVFEECDEEIENLFKSEPRVSEAEDQLIDFDEIANLFGNNPIW